MVYTLREQVGLKILFPFIVLTEVPVLYYYLYHSIPLIKVVLGGKYTAGKHILLNQLKQEKFMMLKVMKQNGMLLLKFVVKNTGLLFLIQRISIISAVTK